MLPIIIYSFMVLFLYFALVKYKLSTVESAFFLVALSFIKTSVVSLFTAGAIFTAFTIGSIEIHVDDIIFLLLLFPCINVFKTGIKKNLITLLLLIALIPMVFSIIRGLLDGNLPSTPFFNDIRKFVLMYVVICAFYRAFNTATKEQLIRIKKMLDVLMNCFAIYIVVIWFLDFFLGINYFPGQISGLASDGGSTFRFVRSYQILVLSGYSLWELFENITTMGKIRIRTILFIVIVILSQWRTVVVAFLIGAIIAFVGLLFSKEITMTKTLISQLVLLFAAIIIFLLFSNGRLFKMIINLFNSYQSISAGTGTFSTRTDAWEQLLGSLTKAELFIGQSFGSGYKSSVDWAYSAHNAYVDYIVVFGIIGLIAFLLLMLYIIICCFRRKQFILLAITVSIMIYWMGYGFSIEQGAFIGFSLSYIYKQQKERELYP